MIDRKKPKVDEDFFYNKYQDIKFDIYQSYSLSEWVQDVFSKCESKKWCNKFNRI